MADKNLSRRHSRPGGIEEAKEYMADREIPQLFESMMTALMYRKPPNHLEFLQGCIDRAKDQQKVHWHSFIEPLPPIPQRGGGSAIASEMSPPTVEPKQAPPAASFAKKKSPLPGIGSSSPSQVTDSHWSEEDIAQYTNANVDMSFVAGKPIVFVLGGPGSGKGTQCALIVERFSFTHLSAGDILREEVAKGTPIGSKINATMKEGQLVPQAVPICLLKQAMVSNADSNGFLIDGFPRETEQGLQFEKECGLANQLLFYTCPDEVLTQRLLARALHSGRTDDNEESIIKRLKVFHEKTAPVVNYYENITIQIDANRPKEEVFRSTCEGLEEMIRSTEKVSAWMADPENESSKDETDRVTVAEEPCVATEEVIIGGGEGNTAVLNDDGNDANTSPAQGHETDALNADATAEQPVPPMDIPDYPAHVDDTTTEAATVDATAVDDGTTVDDATVADAVDAAAVADTTATDRAEDTAVDNTVDDTVAENIAAGDADAMDAVGDNIEAASEEANELNTLDEGDEEVEVEDKDAEVVEEPMVATDEVVIGGGEGNTAVLDE